MKISYDYGNFIDEFNECLLSGELALKEEIQILREDRVVYSPIIDWYYSKSRMVGLEDENYKKDLPNLETISVAGVMIEMEKYNKIL